MNDPRVELFLAEIRRTMSGLTATERIDERLRELRSHIELSVLEFTELQVEDPVGKALLQFGSVETYQKSVKSAGGGVLLRQAERTTLLWLSAVLLVPICADLLMDFSSYLTGSDSGMWAVGVPVCAFLTWRFGRASFNCRRHLGLQITAIVAACSVWFVVLGGFSKAASGPLEVGIQSRGTAARRLEGLKSYSLSAKQAKLAMIEKGISLFSKQVPTMGIGEFRVAQGYLVPRVRDESVATYSAVGAEPRSTFDAMELQPVPTFDDARRTWIAAGPGMLKTAHAAIRLEQDEIRDLTITIHSSWLSSVRVDYGSKCQIMLAAWFGLMLVHAVAMASGLLVRRLRPPTQTA